MIQLFFSAFFFIFSSTFFSAGFAYVPPSDFILQRTAETSLRSPVAIEYEVTIQAPNQAIVLTEQWFIEDASKMRMKTTRGPQIEIIYQGGERSFLDRQGRKTQRTSSEFLERLAFISNSESYRKFMQDLGVPGTSITTTPHLSRADGVVNYGFFQRTPEALQILNPGIWIEQDQFLVRQIRFKSGAQLNLADYRPYGKTAMLPFQKIIRWKNFQAKIRVSRLIPKTKFSAQEVSNLDTVLDLGQMEPEVKQAVLEFYSRFR